MVVEGKKREKRAKKTYRFLRDFEEARSKSSLLQETSVPPVLDVRKARLRYFGYNAQSGWSDNKVCGIVPLFFPRN